jgi:3',5'-cyclic AMP phosphodiesterase CpdA
MSDIQTPLFPEKLLLRPEGNVDATRALVVDILAASPDRLFILGDLVSLGFQHRAWEDIRRYVEDMRRDSIRVDAILGNHELMLYPVTGEENFQEIFPEHRRTGYMRTTDSVAVLLLNSNLANLSDEERAVQREWYTAALDSLDSEPAVITVIVCAHHSPYSGSTVVGSSADVQRELVPPFMAARKTLLFMSGHAHGFEWYRRGGKDFFVIGGGGGLRHPLEDPEEGTLTDLALSLKPRFHYILIRRQENELILTVRGILSEGSPVAELAEFLIPSMRPPTR